MSIKIFPFLLAVLAALMFVQPAASEEGVGPGAVYIKNLDTNPEFVSLDTVTQELSSPASAARRGGCTRARCNAICWALGFRWYRCATSSICQCRN